jgi:hypothetical protein
MNPWIDREAVEKHILDQGRGGTAGDTNLVLAVAGAAVGRP